MPEGRTPERKALDYALGLGLNSAYETAVESRNELEEVLADLSKARDKRRELEAARHNREMDVLQIEGGVHPEMSVAALERHLKVAYHNDSILIELRLQLSELTSRIDSLELAKQISETDIKIAIARLTELGGYFQFAAVIKNASEARKASESSEIDPDNPWRV